MRAKSLLQEQAYSTIKEMILSGELEPNVLYSETKMSGQLGISRTPMREALQCLSQDGYISIIPSKGFSIRQLNADDMRETIQVRCALEGFCVQLIASESESRNARELFDRLDWLLKKMEEAVQWDDFPQSFMEYDHQFHQELIQYVDNSEFSRLFDRLMYQIHLTTTAALAVPGRVQGTIDEHQQVYDYMKLGDGDGAYRFMIAHLMQPLNMKMLTT